MKIKDDKKNANKLGGLTNQIFMEHVVRDSMRQCDFLESLFGRCEFLELVDRLNSED